MPSKALVTGAAGFIGKHVVGQLLETGWTVIGYDLIPRPVSLECDWHQASILDTDKLREAMTGVDTVFHLAANAHLFAKNPRVFDEVNHQGTCSVLGAALEANVKHLIATLSAVALTPIHYDGVISPQSPRPQRSALAGPYAQSKWDADAALSKVSKSDIGITRLFPTVPIGPGDDGFTAPTDMIRLFLTKPPPAYLETALNFVPVEDVARAHVAASTLDFTNAGNTQRQYILAGERWPLSTLLAVLARKTGRRMPRRTIPYPVARAAATCAEQLARLRGTHSLATIEGVRLTTSDPVFDTRDTRSALVWNPSPVDAALTSLLKWMVETHHIECDLGA